MSVRTDKPTGFKEVGSHSSCIFMPSVIDGFVISG